MKPYTGIIPLLILSMTVLPACNKSISPSEDYLKISAGADDPLYTTYTADMKRSRLYGDKGYKMDHYSDFYPVNYASDQAGRMFSLFKIDQVVVRNAGEYHWKPVAIYSFPDMVMLEYQPFEGIQVIETFMVYSSRCALADLQIQNISQVPHRVEIYPIIELGNDSLQILKFDKEHNGYRTYHYESPKRLISDLRIQYGYPTHMNDFFSVSDTVYSYGGYPGSMGDFYNTIKTDFYSEDRPDTLNHAGSGYMDLVALHCKFTLQPGENRQLRYVRGIQGREEDIQELMNEIENLKGIDLDTFFQENIRLFSRIPRIDLPDVSDKIVYLSAFNLARGCMVPPAGQTQYNSYAFSREPLWGWGHGHQVLHESLSMLAYVYLDPVSAQESQRLYMEQQRGDGLIAYRHGPRGRQDYPHYSAIWQDTMSTTSAPFFSWINWEIYQVSKDRQFLEDAYTSGVNYVNWLIANRDFDRDSLFEWGPYGIIENVRDWYNAVFQVSAERYLDVDKEDISDELECLDLSLMVVKEMRCLGEMAQELDERREEKYWKGYADQISQKINDIMWDEESRFFYSVNRVDHSFFFMDRDLRRQEIIGFLPLWAETVSEERAALLIETLIDTTKFWRKYGIPTLSADDEWYSPYVDYCCKWNGPVWLLWDYMVYDGLRNYGYDELAAELADKMLLTVKTQLSKNHNFWESYSPDNDVLNCPSNYIWDAIIAKVLVETYLELP
ncbi:MAG: trehalase family glycosidase [Bacteroidales bacterium]|nr:trehalase family glycosidase [Bacteroidales bacterium]